MHPEALDRARRRLAGGPRAVEPSELEATVARAREALESLAAQTAEIERAVPERLSEAVQESMRAEVLPVGRHVAEVRGLANQTVGRLERIELALDAERRARVEDLGVLVDLVASGWQGLDRRLDRLERVIDRLERSLEDRPVAELLRFDAAQERRTGSA